MYCCQRCRAVTVSVDGCLLKHWLVVIFKRPDVVRRVFTLLDIMFVHGNDVQHEEVD